LSKTITSVLGNQQSEFLEVDGRKLLVIFGKTDRTPFAIVPGWYIGNERYQSGNLTAVDVELIDSLEQYKIKEKIQPLLEKRGYANARISFWGASGFSNDYEAENNNESSQERAEKKGKILIVDDDPGIREIVKIYLQRQGYDAVTASNSKDASSLLRNEPIPNLMLLDIMMPGATGWQLLKDLENDPRLNKLPVIAISGLEKPKEVGDEYDSKMLYDYLVKPFSMEELSRAVEKFRKITS
jgi:CheY-like chemotaxis protein